jgi:Tfp pilus assembly protein PilF
MNQINESRSVYESILENEPRTAHAHYGLGRIRAKLGDQRAVESLKEAVRLSPSWGAAHYALALVYRDNNSAAQAAEHFRLYEKFRLVRPAQADPLLREVAELNIGAADRLRKGVELEASGKLAESIAEHERALETDPQLVQAHINLIQLYARSGLTVKAEEHYRAVVRLNPNLAESHYNFGVMLVEQKRLDEAAKAFERAIEANPHYAEAHLNYGSLFETRRQFDEALKHYRLAVENQPNNRLAHFHLARMLIYRTEFQDAISHLHQTLTPEDSETPRFTYALAAAYARAGDRASGLKYGRLAREKAAALNQSELLGQIDKFLKTLDQQK